MSDTQSPAPEPDVPEGAHAEVPGPAVEVGEVHLLYEIEGQPNEVPVFELSRTLEALGNVIQEGDQIINADRHELIVKVKPFQQGSFVMDLVLSIQNNPTVLFFLTQNGRIVLDR